MAYRKLGRETRHRRSMLATLTKELIEHERIVTTETRAKEVRKCFDKMVTYGKSGSLVSRRLALAFLHNDEACVKNNNHFHVPLCFYCQDVCGGLSFSTS